MEYNNDFIESDNASFLDLLDENIILVNKNGEILYINKAFLKRLEYCNKELLGKNINNIILENNIKEIIEKKPSSYYLRLFSKNNDLVNLDIKVIKRLFKNQYVYYIIGKEIEEKVHFRTDIEELFEDIPYYVSVKDSKCRYVYVNNAFQKFLGKNKKDIYGKKIDEILSTRLKSSVIKSDEEALRTKEEIISEEKIWIDGKECIIECYKKPIVDKFGEIKALIGIAHNITLKKLINEDVVKSDFDLLTIYNLFDKKNRKVNKDSLLNELGPHIVGRFGAKGAGIYLYDFKEDGLNLYSNYGLTKVEAEEIERWINENKVSNCVKEIYTNKVDGMYKWRSELDYIAVYPIKFEKKAIGLLIIGYKSRVIPVHIENILIDAICNQLGIIIKNNILFDEVKKNVEEKLEAEKDVNVLFNTGNEVVSVIDSNGKLIKINGNWKNILGWNEKDVLGKKFIEYVYADERDEARIIMSNQYENYRLINRQLCKDKTYKWISWQIRYMKDKDIFISSGKDITEAVLMERKNKLLEEDMKLETIKSEYFANMSHELKTPLNIILSTMQLLDMNIENGKIYADSDVDINRYIKSIRQNSYRLLKLVNNIIDQGKIDNGYLQLQKGNYNIIKIVEDITLSSVQLVESKGIKLTFDTDTEELMVACDLEKIERIMLNLLSNATKYTEKNGEIFVCISSTEKEVKISVKDNGIGIPEDRLEHIFNRFEQVDNKITRNSLGSGIGLNLVKSLVEMHNGSIEVKSKYGQGCEFIFTIPNITMAEDEESGINKELTIGKSERCNIEFSYI
ncbi:sensor histidine kinase [Clostridium septicum]|uniref:histidine kinase n=1 Tax=Clostridium septicum TaxID=1504 RepID=A0A9N7PMH1_CLOSE|nr:PAS domain S-box protein [Clostridium septicum]AYE35102.1 hypothetical protein CP523_12125 [Clostridium septicum]MDU1312693.1 PAS domain S-box protein [Clostridium septicum]QAS60495.1 PAS domain S-box protein [Clostridium septicum]UEC20247.1 PAS domain S-box protein [Clostridium septicum]USS01700.1 PAS domain S-box protein [Clostridium septicum]